MKTKNIILKLRTERGMSQDELADKIMVTRQAVSRWENGDTVPNTDTLKLLSKEFDVSINTLLGEPRKLFCQCCGMPIDDDSILGRDKDGTLNEEYCKWCYVDGLVICCFAAARDGLDKTIQAAVDGSCIPGIFPLISIPTIVGCIGAAMIIVAAVATPIAKSQRMREIWFYVMSSGVMLKVVVMELARIIQFI